MIFFPFYIYNIKLEFPYAFVLGSYKTLQILIRSIVRFVFICYFSERGIEGEEKDVLTCKGIEIKIVYILTLASLNF